MSEPSVVIVIVDEDRFIRHFVRVALKAEHMHVFEAATERWAWRPSARDVPT